jgi:membrane protein YdbS with pleckstrin-like domain
VKQSTEKAAVWMYRGIWSVLTGWFRVPEKPPTLPVGEGETLLSFHPSRRYLYYLMLYFWIAFVLVDVAILIGWLIVFAVNRALAMLLALPALALAILPGIVAYIMIHLRYDTMWYVMSERSLRCRRGIWTILEHTITFENVQNVLVRRGPVQYFLGISTILIETAGASESEGDDKFAVGNKAIMEGIDNPEEIRALILEKVRRSRSAGLGDEPTAQASAGPTFEREHVEALREILVEVRRIV